MYLVDRIAGVGGIFMRSAICVGGNAGAPRHSHFHVLKPNVTISAHLHAKARPSTTTTTTTTTTKHKAACCLGAKHEAKIRMTTTPLSPHAKLLATGARMYPYYAEGVRSRLSHATVDALIHRFCPILRHDSRERYFPSTFSYYVKHSALLYRMPKDKGGRFVTIVPEGKLNMHTLLACTHNGESSDRRRNDPVMIHSRTGFHFKPNRKIRGGCGADAAIMRDVPLYADFRYDVYSHMYEIRYMFFYPYNGPGTIFGMKEVGAHDADLEHCTVRLSPHTLKMHSMYFGAHGYVDGTWCDAKDVERDAKEPTRPVCYVARGFHGVYPHAGNHKRISRLLFLRDYYDGAGVEWRPRLVVPVMQEQFR
jgi:hypothetical protein